jgi:hypothetical protein
LKSSRLCAKHFTNEQFVVNPLFAASIGYKMKKLILKPDAEPYDQLLFILRYFKKSSFFHNT